MKDSRRTLTGIWATVHAHAIPIVISVALSVALCRVGLVFAVIIIAGIVAAFVWIGGWRIEIHRHGSDQHSYQQEGIDEHNDETQ